jgi:hypothetical protein
MKNSIRVPWLYNGLISLSVTIKPKLSYSVDWRHTDSLSAHLVKLRYGRLRIVRLRRSADHARRLGLPVI